MIFRQQQDVYRMKSDTFIFNTKEKEIAQQSWNQMRSLVEAISDEDELNILLHNISKEDD